MEVIDDSVTAEATPDSQIVMMMEISSVNFIHLSDITRSSCEKYNFV
jgi:hypothetical protein